MDQAWQSDQFNQIRSAFDRGERHPACVTCWRQESVGQTSPRAHYTKRQLNSTGIDNQPTQPQSMQWSFSNTCNFACRTCNLEYSTGWLRETRALADQGDDTSADLVAQFAKSPWDQTRMEEIVPHLDSVTHLELFGGETLLSARMPQLLQLIINRGLAPQITLKLTTNGSVSPTPQLIDQFTQFNEVEITFSIDAVTPDTFKYIRTGDWHQVSENIDQWREQASYLQRWRNTKVGIFANPTFSVLNVWDCDRILKHLGKRFGITNVGWNWVESPAYYNSVHLPESIKQHIKQSNTYFHSQKLLPQLWSSPRSDALWQSFLQRTEWLDQSRSQPMKKYMPELYDMIYTHTKESV